MMMQQVAEDDGDIYGSSNLFNRNRWVKSAKEGGMFDDIDNEGKGQQSNLFA